MKQFIILVIISFGICFQSKAQIFRALKEFKAADSVLKCIVTGDVSYLKGMKFVNYLSLNHYTIPTKVAFEDYIKGSKIIFYECTEAGENNIQAAEFTIFGLSGDKYTLGIHLINGERIVLVSPYFPIDRWEKKQS